MNLFLRWCKFNLVGVFGMLVQLATLALLERCTGTHYLIATALAIEITLLHNFVWHLHFTWRDRRDPAVLLVQCVRFHLSNGLVSMLGNLALMRLFVRGAHLSVLPANAIAILCCSLVNFFLSDRWAFAGRSPASAALPYIPN
ncbi:MAG TPA: GtrA family protein [Acidobacteriaceae bacterium]|nr:GtrA family protein [Acidobacteriaceae bacterium]